MAPLALGVNDIDKRTERNYHAPSSFQKEKKKLSSPFYMLTLQLHMKLGGRGQCFSVLHRLIPNSRPTSQVTNFRVKCKGSSKIAPSFQITFC
uniref:Uncharacterized protein n=1 Tax=Arundo donax TaxID=35708 RepID=A0A0A9BUI7_ARUDO